MIAIPIKVLRAWLENGKRNVEMGEEAKDLLAYLHFEVDHFEDEFDREMAEFFGEKSNAN